MSQKSLPKNFMELNKFYKQVHDTVFNEQLSLTKQEEGLSKIIEEYNPKEVATLFFLTNLDVLANNQITKSLNKLDPNYKKEFQDQTNDLIRGVENYKDFNGFCGDQRDAEWEAYNAAGDTALHYLTLTNCLHEEL